MATAFEAPVDECLLVKAISDNLPLDDGCVRNRKMRAQQKCPQRSLERLPFTQTRDQRRDRGPYEIHQPRITLNRTHKPLVIANVRGDQLAQMKRLQTQVVRYARSNKNRS